MLKNEHKSPKIAGYFIVYKEICCYFMQLWGKIDVGVDGAIAIFMCQFILKGADIFMVYNGIAPKIVL